jgi:hypothetical protein
MINRRHLPLILTALLLHAAPLLAQTVAVPESEPSEVPVNSPAAGETGRKAPVASETPPPGGAKKPANDSPYDYRSSEEISEDLSVSFPVDI